MKQCTFENTELRSASHWADSQSFFRTMGWPIIVQAMNKKKHADIYFTGSQPRGRDPLTGSQVNFQGSPDGCGKKYI